MEAVSSIHLIFQLFERIWASCGAADDFIGSMRQAVAPMQASQLSQDKDPSRWGLLPGLCSQAAGGDPHWADGVAAAWLLLYAAAHLMDSVEDADDPNPWWAELGPGAALNAATGLYFTAWQVLNGLHDQAETKAVAVQILDDFARSFLVMSGGQHRDLVLAEPTLEQCWEIAAAKSGTFFSLACRSGARLAMADPGRLEAYSLYGRHLGILIQVLDDLEDLQPGEKSTLPKKWSEFKRSLPVVYTLEVSPPALRARLRECLQAAQSDPGAAAEAIRLIEESGGGLYLSLEVDRHRSEAIAALERARPVNSAAEKLSALVQNLGSA